MQRQRWWLCVLAVGFVVAMGSVPRGHTPIASRWNFNEHLYPVFKERMRQLPYQWRCRADVTARIPVSVPMDAVDPRGNPRAPNAALASRGMVLVISRTATR